jgi:hypothetical protein
MDRNYHGAKLSISVSVPHQSAWKFCMYFYMGFVALLTERHHLHALVQVLHLLVGRKQSPFKVLCTFSNILRCGIMWNGYCCWYSTTAVLPFPLQKPHTKCMSAYYSFVNMLGILIITTLQHTTQPHLHRQCTSKNLVKLQQLQLAPLAFNSVRVSN